jgi:MinD-like ATPase involved in chromosome partitioning or flagellar assembly
MKITSFYSYKGGVGRTLACANFGLYLAKAGQRVVLLDMDFEAPGLDAKFPALDASKTPFGLLDLFSAYQKGTEIPPLAPLKVELPQDIVFAGGRLHVIPAGNYSEPDYHRKLSELHWEKLLDKPEGLAFCDGIMQRIGDELGADMIVIDSRSGLTEAGGLCTQILPDTVILMTCTSADGMAGTKRMYDRIGESAPAKGRSSERPKVDRRVVISRIPRPENLADLERALTERLPIDAPRLYYLFDQRDLSLEEYLALNRFEDHPAILDDYVELFASLGMDASDSYIAKRVQNFRESVTQRSPQQNERVIRELLALFPHPEVFLEAARYYRLVKDGEDKAMANFLRYLDCHEEDEKVRAEFVEFCASVSLYVAGNLKSRAAKHMHAFGEARMNAKQTAYYFQLDNTKETARRIVDAIEAEGSKLKEKEFRASYFRALSKLGEWEKMADLATKPDLEIRDLLIHFARAFAALNRSEEALHLLSLYHPNSRIEISQILHEIFRIAPTVDAEAVKNVLGHSADFLEGTPHLPSNYIISGDDPDFEKWFANLDNAWNTQ